jgi:HEAT repeat protein
MQELVSDVVMRILYKESLDVELLESEVALLNSFPTANVVPVLQSIFYREHDDVVKSRTFHAITSVQAFDTVQFLLNLLNLSSYGWRAAYCEELSRFHDVRAIAQLCEILLDDPDPNMRYTAAKSLAEVGDSTAVEALEYAQANDTGTDFEGFPVAEMAKQALQQIRNRANT